MSSRFKLTVVGDTHIDDKNSDTAENLKIPVDSDMVFGLGDWVESGRDEEYVNAILWSKSLNIPFTMVRGNHDNGVWHPAACQVCMPSVSEQLSKYPIKMGMVLWQPMIWKEIDNPELPLPAPKDWQQLPVKVQGQIIKMRNLNPAYYTFEAGDMFFICLDTSNWLLGVTQMEWLKQQLKNAVKPVVLVGHHHFLPVDIIFDTCQVHERDFLRELVLDDKNNIIAYLHGHAHKDCWWKYGHVDIIAARNRSLRSVTFQDGKVVFCDLDGREDYPVPFQPRYLCAQSFCSARISYLADERFQNPWNNPRTPCLGWHSSDAKNVGIIWSMRLPENISEESYSLSFQIVNQGDCYLTIESPESIKQIKKEIKPNLEGQQITIELGQLFRGYYEVGLNCEEGYGYIAMAAVLDLAVST